MLTFLLIVLAAVLAVGMCGMVLAALNGCLLSSLWLMCGGFGSAAEFLGELLAAIAKGLTE